MNEKAATDLSKSEEGAPPAQKPAKPTAHSKAEAVADAGADSALLDRLLAMAHDYRRTGDLNQAMEMYWSLLDDHPGTPQARRAGASLFEVAQGYESTGSKRMARSIYTRLL